tara:strand:+ start:476 stop:1366 length:891 start_codon:yes stop_codon:yes gene_type:complete
LSREFVTVADEAYMLYPEHEGNLQRVKDRPQHQFFKRYGEAMPAGDWHHPGTKQGLYMIGPNGEYLEGKFAASGLPDDIGERLERALDRWQKLRREKKYANKSVPRVASTLPPGFVGKDFVLHVYSRDLPRGDAECGVRFDKKVHQDAIWIDFIKWAWNENWLDAGDWRVLVPKGRKAQPVDQAFIHLVAQQMLIDNVRGQARTWPKSAIRTAKLTMKGKPERGGVRITYRGEVDLDDGARSIRAQIYGEGRYDSKRRDLVEFELLVTGLRTGKHGANQRAQDLGPAPIGFSIKRY